MEPILHSFAYSLDYLREMLADVPDELMAEQPRGMTNHPAWIIGHLVFIAQAIDSVIGINPSPKIGSGNFAPVRNRATS